jgi:hypothetical protein
MARYCDSEMSVGRESGGLAWMKAAEGTLASVRRTSRGRISRGLTLRPEVLGPLQVVHLLQRLGLLAGEGLLVVILAGAADAVQQDAAAGGVAQEVDEQEDEGDEDGAAKGAEQADDDAIDRRVRPAGLDGGGSSAAGGSLREGIERGAGGEEGGREGREGREHPPPRVLHGWQALIASTDALTLEGERAPGTRRESGQQAVRGRGDRGQRGEGLEGTVVVQRGMRWWRTVVVVVVEVDVGCWIWAAQGG